MRRPFIPLHISTGAWIFGAAVAVAIIASPSIYAAATSVVVIGNANNSQTATVVATTHQLQTTLTAPDNVVHAVASVISGCKIVYTPPKGKAIVVTQVSYSYGSGTQGTENFGGLFGANCGAIYDQIDTVQAFVSESRTYPSGLPLAGVSASSNGTGTVTVFVNGYLIPASALPPAAQSQQVSGDIKAMSSR